MIKNNIFINILFTSSLILFSTVCPAKLNLNYSSKGLTDSTTYQYHGKKTASNMHEIASSSCTESASRAAKTKKVISCLLLSNANQDKTKRKEHTTNPQRTTNLKESPNKSKTSSRERYPALKSGQSIVSQNTQPKGDVGIATYYSDSFHGKPTASGEIYDKDKLTTVHPKYPFGTLLRVTNLGNHRSVTVRVNDRASLSDNHLLDLSKQAASELGIIKAGRAKVKIEAI